MPKAYEKIFNVFGMIIAAAALLGLIVFVSWTQNRHSPLMHTVFGYETDSQPNRQLVYSSVDDAPLSLDSQSSSTSSGGCGCPFCCSAG